MNGGNHVTQSPFLQFGNEMNEAFVFMILSVLQVHLSLYLEKM